MTILAILGCSHIHTPNFVKTIKARPELKVKSVWDPNPARSAKWSTELGAATPDDFRSICADPQIQAVIVCSETVRHQELVLPAVAGNKHVFVEKPLGFTAKDAREMASAIETAGVFFQTGYMSAATTNAFFSESR